MTLIVEDGTGKSDSQTYITAVEARSYAQMRGVTLSANDADVEVMLVKAMDYLEAKADQYKGVIAVSTQALQWPRACVSVFGQSLPETAIPAQLKSAEASLVMQISSGIELLPTIKPGGRVKRKKIGPIEKEYFDDSDLGSNANMQAVDALLAPLLDSASGRIMVIRV